jgi:hypothetical protein
MTACHWQIWLQHPRLVLATTHMSAKHHHQLRDTAPSSCLRRGAGVACALLTSQSRTQLPSPPQIACQVAVCNLPAFISIDVGCALCRPASIARQRGRTAWFVQPLIFSHRIADCTWKQRILRQQLCRPLEHRMEHLLQGLAGSGFIQLRVARTIWIHGAQQFGAMAWITQATSVPRRLASPYEWRVSSCSRSTLSFR